MLFLLKNKHVFIDGKINKFTLFFFFKITSFLKKKTMFRLFYKIYTKNILTLSPLYTFSSQFFENKNLFFDVLDNNKVDGFFIYKNLFKITNYYNDYLAHYKAYVNYNFYIWKNSFNVFNSLNEIFQHKDFNKIGKVKYFLNKNVENEVFSKFNFYLNYNFFLLNTIEFYKILIYLHINVFIKNN